MISKENAEPSRGTYRQIFSSYAHMIGQQQRRPSITLAKQQLPAPAPRQHRAARIVLFYTIVILLIALWSSYAGYAWARHQVIESAYLPALIDLNPQGASLLDTNAPNFTSAQGVGSSDDSATATLPPITILLMGTDERPQEGGYANSDTLILLTLNPSTRQAGMLSFSRDLWVNVPAIGEKAKINTVYALGEQNGYPGGGTQLMMDTLSSMIGHPIQYYLRVNFDSFVKIVDMINGIDINVPKTIHDEDYPTADYGIEIFHLDAGMQHLDGELALKYARTRHVDDDYGRQRRQQDVIRAVFDKIRRRDMIPTLISNLPTMLTTLGKSVDTNMLWSELSTVVNYANFLRQNDLQGIQQEVIDKRYGQEDYNSYGQWILIPTPSEVRVAVNRYFGKLTALQSDNGALDTSWVRVEILNGTNKSGVAARTRDLLRQQGWNVVSINDADRDDYAETLIISYGAPAPVLTKMNTDLKLQPDLNNLSGLARNTPIDVKVIVGRDLLAQLGISEP